MSKLQSLVFYLCFTLCSVPLFGQFKGSYKVSSKLLSSLDVRSNKSISVHVVLEDQVNLDAWESYFKLNKLSYEDRAKILIKALKNKATATQPELVEYLKKQPGIEANSLKTHWITNAISFKCSPENIKELAARQDIFWIGENVLLEGTKYETVSLNAAPAPNKIENGLAAINAPAMWALGYTGYGTKVFTADTGVDPTHPAIAHQYHGNYFPRAQSWYPNPFAPGQNANGPFDCSNHGTHVTGTVLGIDRANNDTIGVAFNATWMGGAILCGVGTADNITAFEWAVDPDGDENTVDDMPDAINNSWHDPSLMELDCYSVYVPILNTLELIGIAVIFSAGNEGPDSGTITNPHNVNINEVNAFTVGALNGNSPALPIASFSSRGPSHCEGEGSLKIKPEVSAPGVSVRSCVPGNSYAELSGTSMACPHVAGSILLLKEAFPYLGGNELKTALYRTCTDLGDEGEDNVFGMGIINVFAAYQYLVDDGNVPVDPRKSNDVILLEVKHALMGCNSSIQPYILIENAGLDTLTSAEIVYGSSSVFITFVWEGILEPKQRTYIQLPAFQPGDGFYDLTVEVSKINGEIDGKPLNNKKTLSIVVTDRQALGNNFELDNHLCRKADFILTSPLGSQGSHETNWYDQPFEGEILYKGNLVLLSTDSMIPSLFAEVKYNSNLGLETPDNTVSSFENIKNSGLVFDALGDFTLNSFDIISEAKHTLELVVMDKNDNIIHSTTRPSTDAGLKTMVVNWLIPQGENYRLLKKVGRGLMSQSENVNFPFQIENIVNIKSSVVDDMESTGYKNFFNWQVSFIEPCGRVPHHFTVREDSTLVVAEFDISSDTLRLPDANILEGQALVNDFSTVRWDMGDGTSYNSETISHAYQEAGTYKVCFHVVDQNQCFTAGIKDIVVLQSSSSKDVSNKKDVPTAWIYPNPVSGILTLEMEDQAACVSCPIMFFNQQGRIKSTFYWNNSNRLEVDTDGWMSGIYFIKIFHQNEIQTLRFVKI
ncbi:MAG: S8 family serine peptidase [Saprospiraceae bacterium]